MEEKIGSGSILGARKKGVKARGGGEVQRWAIWPVSPPTLSPSYPRWFFVRSVVVTVGADGERFRWSWPRKRDEEMNNRASRGAH